MPAYKLTPSERPPDGSQDAIGLSRGCAYRTDGQQGDPFHEEEKMIHRILANHGIGFRFFSVKNNQQYYSALNWWSATLSP